MLMNNISFFSPSKSIFNNWTLKYNDNAIETTYTTSRYSITKQCVFIVITIPLSLIILCLSITSLQTNNNTNSANSSKYYYNTIKKYLIALTVLTAFTFVIVVCNLIVVIINKDKSHLYMQLTYITPFIQVSIFTLISECYKMWINSVKQVDYVKCVFIVEMVYRLFYDVICCNKFYIGLLSGCVVYLIMVMLSFFLNGVNTCDTVLSLCGFLCIELMVFFVERKERLVYYYLSKSNEVINTYIQFFKSKKFYFASFSNAATSASCVVNETLNSSIFTKRKSDKKVNNNSNSNNNNKSYYLYCGNTVIDNIIKKFCFGGFTFINPNLPITLRDIMVKISSQYNVNNTSALSYIPHGDNNIKLFQAAKLSNAIIESIQSLFSFFKSSSTNTGSTNVSDNSTVLDVNPHFISTNISPKNKRDDHNNNNNTNNNTNGNSNENELYYLGDKQNPKYPLKTYSIFIHEEETTSQLIYFGISKEFLSHLYHNNTNTNNNTNNIHTNNNPLSSSSPSHNQLEKYAMFTSKMTHEIKNPLLAIQGEIDSLKTSIETQQALNTKTCISSLNLLVDYCQYMLIVTKDFECLAKELKHMDMKTSIDPKPFNIRKAISFCVELIKRIKRVTGLQIVISIANNIDELIISDEIRFKQIIINLLSNSVKFTRFGSVEVKCTNYNDDYIKVAVIDTGFGMKEDELRKLNANVNEDNNNGDTKEEKFLFIKSTKNNDFGSGLGLSIVKSLVKALGKDFKVESEYNKGTTISFKLLKRNKKNDLSPHNNNNIQDLLPSSLSKPEKQSHSYNEHNNIDKNKNAIKHRKSLAETSGRHHLLTKPGSLGRSQTLIRNNVFFNKKHRSKNSVSANNCNNHVDGILYNLSNFRKDTNESLNQVSDSMQKMLDTSNGLNVSLKELNESLSINTQRVDADLKKPKLPNEIYQNIIDGKQNIMESIKYNNDSIDPDPFASNNFKRLYTRLVTTKKDYKLMKTATLKGGGVAQPLGALSNNVQAINKNMNINNQNINININTNTQSNTKKMVDLIMDESEKIRILVVEDDNTIRKSISKTIRDYGKDNGYKVDVEECEDGFECLYKIYIGFSKNHKYKCIITDDQMRFLNGTFMAYLIHLLIEDRILYPVHIYLASSNTFPKDLFRGIKLFNDVFGKPLTKLQISQVFREFEGEGVINELNDVEEDDDERNDVFKEEDYEADEEEEEDEDNY